MGETESPAESGGSRVGFTRMAEAVIVVDERSTWTNEEEVAERGRLAEAALAKAEANGLVIAAAAEGAEGMRSSKTTRRLVGGWAGRGGSYKMFCLRTAS